MLGGMKVSVEEWSERVRAWRESGATAAEFAEARGYRPKALEWWAGELVRRERAKVTTKKVPMARVEVIPREQSIRKEVAMEIVVGRARVVVERGFDASLLREVVEALGAIR